MAAKGRAEFEISEAETIPLSGGPTRRTRSLPTKKRGCFGESRAWVCHVFQQLWVWGNHILQDTWWIEITSCAFAFVVLLAEGLLLWIIHRRALQDWLFDWTPNSILSLMNAGIHATIGSALGACLGQVRWLWFRESNNKLSDFETLTKITTPFGAATSLLKGTVWRNRIASGAIVVIAMLFNDTFTNNIIHILNIPDDFSSPNAMVLIKKDYNTWSYGLTGLNASDGAPSADMIAYSYSGFAYIAETYDGIASNVDDVSDNDVFHCPGTHEFSATCDFGTYDTLAICNQCAQLNVTKGSSQFSIPNSTLTLQFNANYTGYVNITSFDTYDEDSALGAIGPLIARYQAIAVNFSTVGTSSMSAFAHECAAYWCVQTRNGSASTSRLNENYTSWTNLSLEARTRYGQKEDVVLQPDQCYYNGSTQHGTGNCTFRASSAAHQSLQNFLVRGTENTKPFLTGSLTHDSGKVYQQTSLAAGLLWSPCRLAGDCGSHVNYNLFSAFQWMTKYMTNVVRKEKYTLHSFPVSVMLTQPHYVVRWPWFAYPIVTVALTALFVGITIYRSRRTASWKGLSLAMMYLHDPLDDNVDDPIQPSAMYHDAEERMMRLEKKGVRWQFNDVTAPSNSSA